MSSTTLPFRSAQFEDSRTDRMAQVRTAATRLTTALLLQAGQRLGSATDVTAAVSASVTPEQGSEALAWLSRGGTVLVPVGGRLTLVTVTAAGAVVAAA